MVSRYFQCIGLALSIGSGKTARLHKQNKAYRTDAEQVVPSIYNIQQSTVDRSRSMIYIEEERGDTSFLLGT